MASRTSATRSRRTRSPQRTKANNRIRNALFAWLKRPASTAASSQPTSSRFVPSLVLPTVSQVPAGQRRAQEQARRRRQTARQMRRFESAVSRVQMPRLGAEQVALPTIAWGKWHPSRIISFLLVLLTIGAIGWVHYDLEWYVYREYVTFNNLTYHEPDALYSLLDVDGWNIFWITPARVRKQLVALPTIADAEVVVRPPHWITINVQEAVPIARWVTQEGDFWLLPDGTALARMDERYDTLPQIIDNEREASLWGDRAQQRMDPAILRSALALRQILPDVENLYFHHEIGLNFHMPGSDTWVYWGDGSNIEEKYSNLQAVRDLLRKEEQAVAVVDLRSTRPVLRY